MTDGGAEGPGFPMGAGPDTDLLLLFRVLAAASNPENRRLLEWLCMIKLSLGSRPVFREALHDWMGRVLILNFNGEVAAVAPRFNADELVPFFGRRVPEGVHCAMDHDNANSVVEVGLDNFLNNGGIFKLGVAFVVDDYVVFFCPLRITVDLGYSAFGVLKLNGPLDICPGADSF